MFNARTRQRTQSIAPPILGEGFESNPQFLAACAKVRCRARFADNAGTVVYLADYELREELDAVELDEVARLRRAPHSQGERQEFNPELKQISHGLETIKTDQAQVLATVRSVDKKADQVLSRVGTLTEFASESADTREKGFENPLGSRETVAHYLLTMDAMKIERGVAVALARYGYGDSRKQCAATAGVSGSLPAKRSARF